MPVRARGEVDEWAAMLEVQDKLAQQGASEYEMQRRGKQREYMESIQQQVRAEGRSSIPRMYAAFTNSKAFSRNNCP